MKFILGLFALVAVRGSSSDKELDLVIFGDGLSEVNNTFQMSQGAYPYQRAYPEHSFSDESSWTVYYKRYLENNSELRVNMHNFAFSGATTNSSVIPAFTGEMGTWPVPGTAQQFQMFVTSPLEKKKRRTVFQVNVGLNDMLCANPLSAQLNEEVANRIAKLVLDIEDYIGNNSNSIIIVSTIYPVALTPNFRDFAQRYPHFTQEYNKVLLKQLEPSLKRGKTHVFEFTQVVTDFINASGLKQAKCPFTVPRNCSEYLFVDGFYPAATLHRAIAKNMTDFTNNILKRNTQF